MKLWLFIAVGGAIGAPLRYALSQLLYRLSGYAFPLGTLMANWIGSFLIGMLSELLLTRVLVSPATRSFLLVGVLGALTTFSTFSYETIYYLQAGRYLMSLMNVLVNVIGCLLLTIVGIMLARWIG